MQCAECLKDESDGGQFTTCDVCGKFCCEKCFKEWHDGNTLPLGFREAVEKL